MDEDPVKVKWNFFYPLSAKLLGGKMDGEAAHEKRRIHSQW